MAAKSIRPIRIEGNLAYILLTRGYEAVIDIDDVPLVEGRNWSAIIGKSGIVYAKAAINHDGCLLMHRVIGKPSPGMIVDHKDRDGLNNRRANLRDATYSQNAANKRGRSTGSSIYKGVCWAKDTKKWQASIRFDGRECYLGQFETEELAHAAYSGAARLAFKSFARS